MSKNEGRGHVHSKFFWESEQTEGHRSGESGTGKFSVLFQEYFWESKENKQHEPA
jgi:hypothetical protein